MCTLNLKLNPHGPGTSDLLIVKCPRSALLSLSVRGWTKLLDNSCSGYPDLSLSSSRKNQEPRLQSTTKYKFKKKPERKRRIHYFSGLFNLPLVLTRLKLRKIRQHSRFWGPWCLLYPQSSSPQQKASVGQIFWAQQLSTGGSSNRPSLGEAQLECCKPAVWWLSGPTARLTEAFLRPKDNERDTPQPLVRLLLNDQFSELHCVYSAHSFQYDVTQVLCTSPALSTAGRLCNSPLSLAFPCLPQALQELMISMSVAHGSSHSWVLGAAQELEHIMEL